MDELSVACWISVVRFAILATWIFFKYDAGGWIIFWSSKFVSKTSVRWIWKFISNLAVVVLGVGTRQPAEIVVIVSGDKKEKEKKKTDKKTSWTEEIKKKK